MDAWLREVGQPKERAAVGLVVSCDLHGVELPRSAELTRGLADAAARGGYEDGEFIRKTIFRSLELGDIKKVLNLLFETEDGARVAISFKSFFDEELYASAWTALFDGKRLFSETDPYHWFGKDPNLIDNASKRLGKAPDRKSSLPAH